MHKIILLSCITVSSLNGAHQLIRSALSKNSPQPKASIAHFHNNATSQTYSHEHHEYKDSQNAYFLPHTGKFVLLTSIYALYAWYADSIEECRLYAGWQSEWEHEKRFAKDEQQCNMPDKKTQVETDTEKCLYK